MRYVVRFRISVRLLVQQLPVVDCAQLRAECVDLFSHKHFLCGDHPDPPAHVYRVTFSAITSFAWRPSNTTSRLVILTLITAPSFLRCLHSSPFAWCFLFRNTCCKM